MGPDWFTVIAQVINFLILVALLKRFLYGPIINAMERREAEIADRLDQAANKALQADQEAMRYREMQREVADTRDKILAEAREEAALLRRDLKQKVQEEADKSKVQWQESFRQQQEAIEQGFRMHACKQVCAVVRRALTDLADTELEQRMTDVFISRISGVEPAVQKEITDSIMRAGGEIVIRSAFKINPEGRRKIVSAIREQVDKGGEERRGDSGPPELKINFETSGSLICGMEIVAGGRKVAWDMEGYLDELEQSLTEALESGTTAGSPKIHQE